MEQLAQCVGEGGGRGPSLEPMALPTHQIPHDSLGPQTDGLKNHGTPRSQEPLTL